MNKLLRFTVAIILACLFLGMLLYLVGSPTQVMAYANLLSKISISKEMNNLTDQPQADWVATTRDLVLPTAISRQIRQFFLPIVVRPVMPNPSIQGMINQVTETQEYTYLRQLAGELPVWVDDGWYTITWRYTFSGTPIQKATHFVSQHMQDLGLDVEYHAWYDYTNPNVIGQITGLVNPGDIYIIGAHLDDSERTVEGADDNASGSVATLLAADILSQYHWGCTLRFAFWTGEEEGLLGSRAYAKLAKQNGENILGYLNLDMISWNTLGSDPTINLDYNPSDPASQNLSQLFADVISAYNIRLLYSFWGGTRGGSDQRSFWGYGYPSIMAIEDLKDNNPYYHSPGDTTAHTDPTYFTNFVKASIATFAHASGCLITTGTGSSDGHVTAADGGAPIEGATVIATDKQGHHYPVNTDASGYYTRTLMASTYDVTASAYSYLPQTASGVTITKDTITTQDFALLRAPTYTISGTVTESGTGLPLLAEILFAGSPVTVWSDPSTGLYQAVLPEGDYTMQVRANLHQLQSLEIVINHNQTQNFSLEALPCILLVDDDRDKPDVNIYYTSALDNLGADYDIWDTSTGDPTFNDIFGYQMVLWFTGVTSESPIVSTFTESNENDVAAYLDAGGNFFLSSMQYPRALGLTFFSHNYLGVSNYWYDEQFSITGQNMFSGLGPYSLEYPGANFSGEVYPNAQAQSAFMGGSGDAAISYAGENFNTVFFDFPFESIDPLADRTAVMGRLLDFFGWQPPENDRLDGHVLDAETEALLESAVVSDTPGMVGVSAISDPYGYYTMTHQLVTIRSPSRWMDISTTHRLPR
jgi:hypothetical protein